MRSKPPQKMPSSPDAGHQVLLEIHVCFLLKRLIGANVVVYFLLPRVFSSIFCEKGSSPRQSTVRHEAPPQNRGADLAHGSRSLQKREEARRDSVRQQPERAREGAGARQQPEHHLLSQAEEILKYSKARTCPGAMRFQMLSTHLNFLN